MLSAWLKVSYEHRGLHVIAVPQHRDNAWAVDFGGHDGQWNGRWRIANLPDVLEILGAKLLSPLYDAVIV